MCGIAGLALTPTAPQPEASTLAAMAAALAHRGPDGHGDVRRGQTALVHTRLSIVDLLTGDQPLYRASRVLVANGEIYNDLATRRALPDIAFTTGSDCEPPLYLHERHGPGMAAHLRGMYAIALHDDADGSLTLARDPFGIKPLYLAHIPGGIAFASEPAVLTKSGLVPPRINPQARAELLQTQFSLGHETLLAGITRVPPGATLTLRDGRITDQRVIASLPDGGPETITEEAALKRLDAAIMDAVDVHQRSDVPYGLFLSGGIDSATILAAMARLNDRPVQAFTAGFDIAGAADEREAAARAAKSVRADHVAITVTEAMVWQHLPQIVACMDDAAADYAIIPTWFLARRARQDVKVVLCGEGGDELFGGYGRYRKAMRPWFFGGKRIRLRGTFDGLGVLKAPVKTWRQGLEETDRTAASAAGRSRLQIAQAADILGWLPNDLLLKADRCLMANGVEGRTPFLDPAITAASFRLPDHLKVRDGRGKYLLRRWLAGAMPAANPFAPKQGFTVPIGQWIAQQASELGPRIAAHDAIAEIADPDAVRRLFTAAASPRHGIAAWHLLFYALWHTAHIQSRPTDGHVLDVLR